MALSAEAKAAIELSAGMAAEIAVQKTLLTLGVDASTPAGIQEHQQDMAFIRKWRLTSEKKSLKVTLILIAAGLSLLSGATMLILEKVVLS